MKQGAKTRGRNALVLAVLALAMLLVLLAALLTQRKPSVTLDELPMTAEGAARGYVRITAGKANSGEESRWAALPSAGEQTIVIRQGEGADAMENVLRLTPDGVAVVSANCDNQDCVEQGTVTLDNKDARALGSMIICLPHQVSVELYAAEELLGAK